ncbi:MAG TPA: hypothetical protein VMW76_08950 [Bacteroidales bacterium]|nr:hypothetical protein [Bacteroidales bacterium]
MNTVVRILLVAVILLLAYLLIDSIMNPIRFNRERDVRETAIKERLIDVRTAEVAFKSKYGRYTGSFDTLINFVKTDSFPLIFKEGSLTDDMIEEGITSEREALRRGLIIRDTSYTSVIDSIFDPGFNVDSIRYVPFCPGDQFFLAAATILTGSKVMVEVFEANVLNNIFLHGLDNQLIINYNALREKLTGFPGMRVGNIIEPNNNAGNWEN